MSEKLPTMLRLRHIMKLTGLTKKPAIRWMQAHGAQTDEFGLYFTRSMLVERFPDLYLEILSENGEDWI